MAGAPSAEKRGRQPVLLSRLGHSPTHAKVSSSRALCWQFINCKKYIDIWGAVWKRCQENPAQGLQDCLNALKLDYTRAVPQVYRKAGVSFEFSGTYTRTFVRFLQTNMAGPFRLDTASPCTLLKAETKLRMTKKNLFIAFLFH